MDFTYKPKKTLQTFIRNLSDVDLLDYLDLLSKTATVINVCCLLKLVKSECYIRKLCKQGELF